MTMAQGYCPPPKIHGQAQVRINASSNYGSQTLKGHHHHLWKAPRLEDLPSRVQTLVLPPHLPGHRMNQARLSKRQPNSIVHSPQHAFPTLPLVKTQRFASSSDLASSLCSSCDPNLLAHHHPSHPTLHPQAQALSAAVLLPMPRDSRLQV
jgi:hypothetical protein